MIQPNRSPVTGREPRDALSPRRRALSEFYRALNGRDMELMALNWGRGADAVMDNPLGGVCRGWDEIRTIYRELFDNPQPYRFEFYDYTCHEGEELFYVVGRERGSYGAGEAALSMEIRTTRVFRLTDGAWRQVHHHGSIEDPHLLAACQQAVAGGSGSAIEEARA